MTNTDRDTHFSGFAKALFADLDWSDIYIDEEREGWQGRWETIIAQRAYDLAMHILAKRNVNGRPSIYDKDELQFIPDMLELPELEPTNRKQILAEIARISQEAGEYD